MGAVLIIKLLFVGLIVTALATGVNFLVGVGQDRLAAVINEQRATEAQEIAEFQLEQSQITASASADVQAVVEEQLVEALQTPAPPPDYRLEPCRPDQPWPPEYPEVQ